MILTPSSKPKYPRADAINVAREIVKAIEGDVEKLIIAGSLRRGKQFVGDVEVLYIPKLREKVKEQAGLFGDFEQVEYENLTDLKLEKLLADGTSFRFVSADPVRMTSDTHHFSAVVAKKSMGMPLLAWTASLFSLPLHRNFIGIERDAAHYKTACDRIAHELDGALL